MPYIKRELVLTPESDETFTKLVSHCRKSTGTKVTTSHVARSLLKAVAHSMDHLERETRRLGRLKLPSNARDSLAERERFEAKLADAFLRGLRAAAAFDPDA